MGGILRRALPAIAAGVLTISSFSTAYAFDPQGSGAPASGSRPSRAAPRVVSSPTMSITASPGGDGSGTLGHLLLPTGIEHHATQISGDATKVDGIATYGFGGDDATDPLVDQAFAQGIVFTTLNTSLPKAQETYSPKGLGYIGANNYAAGFALGTEAAKRASLKTGDKVFVWGLKGQGGDRGQRTVGVVDAFQKVGADVIYQEIDAATNADPNAGTATFVGVMKKNPEVKIVVTDHGGLTSNVGVYARAASLEPGKVLFAGFDMSPNTAQAVKDGFQNLVIDQQPFLQGYLPILNICLTKKYGFSGFSVNTAGAFVDKTNIDAVAPLAAQEIR